METTVQEEPASASISPLSAQAVEEPPQPAGDSSPLTAQICEAPPQPAPPQEAAAAAPTSASSLSQDENLRIALQVATLQEQELPTEHSSGKRTGLTKKAIQLLGFDEQQIFRAKALEKLGLSEEDMYLSEPYFQSAEKQERIRQAYLERGYSGKIKQLTGMTEEQILRKKAVDTLGTSENEIDQERVEKLAGMGMEVAQAAADEKPSCLS